MATKAKKEIILPKQAIEKIFAYNDTDTVKAKRPSPNKAISFAQIVSLIRDGHNKHASHQYKPIQEAAKHWYEQGDQRAKANLDVYKSNLHWLILNGFNTCGHAETGLKANGYIQIDVDFHAKGGHTKAELIKALIKAKHTPFIAFCATSPTGYGLKLLIKTNVPPNEMTPSVFRYSGGKIIDYLIHNFGIEESECDRTSLTIAQVCYLPYDPSVYANFKHTDFEIDITELQRQQEAVKERKASRKLFAPSDDITQQAIKFLIDSKAVIANCYAEYIPFTAACLHTFGIDEGKEIAFEVLENSPSFKVSTFRKTFDRSISSLSKQNENSAQAGTILFHAFKNGFEYKRETVLKRLDECQFDNLDLFIVDRKNALERIKADKKRKIIICEDSFIETAESELKGKRFDLKSTKFDTIVCPYNEQSKLSIDLLTGANVYFFGANNLNRNRYTNTANEVERLGKITNVVLFADTPTYLHIAQSITTIGKYTNTSKVIESDNPQATFIELIKKQRENSVQYLETSESINRQLQGYEVVKRSQLYKADHKKPLYVLYDSNVQLMPEAFAQFENVVFVANSEKKPCVNMTTFCNANSKQTNDALQFIDNDVFRCDIEKMLFETVRNKKIAIRRNGSNWERCPNIQTVLESEHQIKILYSDATQLQKHIESFTTVTTENIEISEETQTIIEEIKQAKKDLATEKKDEYFEFLAEIEELNIDSFSELSKFVASKEEMSRGGKIAYQRLKTLCKANDSFVICFDAVQNSYTGWTKTKGRFIAAKVVKTETKQGKSLQTFRDTTDGNQYTKADLIEIAKATLNTIYGNDTEVWKQLKRICFISDKRIRIDGKQARIYEAIFLE